MNDNSYNLAIDTLEEKRRKLQDRKVPDTHAGFKEIEKQLALLNQVVLVAPLQQPPRDLPPDQDIDDDPFAEISDLVDRIRSREQPIP
jgi:hypothetical protein